MAVEKQLSDQLAVALLSSIVPEYLKGLPVMFTRVDFQDEDIVTVEAETFPDEDHLPRELMELITWAIVDVTGHEEWECTQSAIIEDMPGRLVGQLKFERR